MLNSFRFQPLLSGGILRAGVLQGSHQEAVCKELHAPQQQGAVHHAVRPFQGGQRLRPWLHRALQPVGCVWCCSGTCKQSSPSILRSYTGCLVHRRPPDKAITTLVKQSVKTPINAEPRRTTKICTFGTRGSYIEDVSFLLYLL